MNEKIESDSHYLHKQSEAAFKIPIKQEIISHSIFFPELYDHRSVTNRNAIKTRNQS